MLSSQATRPFLDDPDPTFRNKLDAAYLRQGLSALGVVGCPRQVHSALVRALASPCYQRHTPACTVILTGAIIETDCRHGVVCGPVCVILKRRPGCNNSIVPASDAAQRCSCSCGMEYCSKCQEPWHPHTPCENVAAIARHWFWWLNTGYQAYLTKHAQADAAFATALQAYAEKKDHFDGEVQEAMQRRQQLERDEAWKAANCKRCPHCARVVERTGGCDSMICGSNADGGNDQNGCGQTYRWPDAAPYSQDATFLGASGVGEFAEVLPENEIKPISLGRTASGEDLGTMKCNECHKDLLGVAFRCINCAGEYTVCIACQPLMVQGRHDGNHVFQIIGDLAAAGGAPDDGHGDSDGGGAPAPARGGGEPGGAFESLFD